MRKFTTRRICLVAALAALSFLLNMVQIKLPMNLRLTFDSLPVVVGSLLLGPVDGMLAALLGEFLTQLLSEYGITATTVLWLIPPALRALVIGTAAWKYRETTRPLERRAPACLGVCLLASAVTTAGNTLVIWLDSVLNGYYSFPLVFGSALARLATGLLTALVIAAVSMPLVLRLRQAEHLTA